MKKLSILVITAFAMSTAVFGGNPDRAGSSGAGHLLINPWARSAGLGGSAMASVTGVEACFLNVAGLAFTPKTDLVFTNNQYLVGSGIKINSFGLGQKLGESSVIGITVMNMNFGDIPITEVDLPEGGIGTFSPNFTNIGLSYAKAFSESIYGGITLRMISESIYNVRSQGVSFDAGIRYVTGEDGKVRFGIALRNVGPPMSYKGDGLTMTAIIPDGPRQTSITMLQRSEKYELPSMVNVGFAYDFIFSENLKLTGDLQFTSNSFSRDQFGLGAELNFRDNFILRGGYQYETNIGSKENSTTVFTGPAAGFTVQVPTGKTGTVIGLDYSYRATHPFAGVHSIGAHITL